MKELEKLRQNLNPKRIEVWVDLEDLGPDTIFIGAEDKIQDLALDQVNALWMDFEAVPNMYEEVMIEFQNMDLFLQVIQKIYNVDGPTLKIELNLKLME